MLASEGLSCKELVELVTEYLEGKLPPSERKRFDDHLAGCDGCTTYLEQMRLTIDTLGTLTEDSLDPHTRDDLLQVFRDWKQRESR
jgi:anti-sigma factor RsiW